MSEHRGAAEAVANFIASTVDVFGLGACVRRHEKAVVLAVGLFYTLTAVMCLMETPPAAEIGIFVKGMMIMVAVMFLAIGLTALGALVYDKYPTQMKRLWSRCREKCRALTKRNDSTL